ncbi:MAG: hypothetical protein MJ206_02805 [Bacilli bacterium]|nr:hypothetical protein [Bacilli bacterium]
MKNKKYLFALPIFALAGSGALVGCGGESSKLLFESKVEVENTGRDDISITIDNSSVYSNTDYKATVTLTQSPKTGAGIKEYRGLPSKEDEVFSISYETKDGKYVDIEKAQYTYEINPNDRRIGYITIKKDVVNGLATKKDIGKTIWISFDGALPTLRYNVGVELDSSQSYTEDDYKFTMEEGTTTIEAGAEYRTKIVLDSKTEFPAPILKLPTTDAENNVSVYVGNEKIDYVDDWTWSANAFVANFGIEEDIACGNVRIVVKLNAESFGLFGIKAVADDDFKGEITFSNSQIEKDNENFNANINLTQKEGIKPSERRQLTAPDKIAVKYKNNQGSIVTLNSKSDYSYTLNPDRMSAKFTLMSAAIATIKAEIATEDIDKFLLVDFGKLPNYQCSVSAEAKDVGPEYHISLTTPFADIGNEYNSGLTLSAKTDDKDFPSTFEHGEIYVDEVKISTKNITWRLMEDKNSAKIVIPGNYVTGDIRIVVPLVDQQ